MSFPSFLTGTLHLPLKEGMSLVKVVSLVNIVYETELDEAEFKEGQVYVGVDGKWTFDLFDLQGNLMVTFANQTDKQAPIRLTDMNLERDFTFRNPMVAASKQETFLTSPVVVMDVSEMNFLTGLKAGDVMPLQLPPGDIPFKLAQLLTRYSVLGRWVSGTLGDYSTAGFSVLYVGPGADAPGKYLISPKLPFVILLQINNGKNQGVLCLQTTST